jgi:hypothetical protein
MRLLKYHLAGAYQIKNCSIFATTLLIGDAPAAFARAAEQKNVLINRTGDEVFRAVRVKVHKLWTERAASRTGNRRILAVGLQIFEAIVHRLEVRARVQVNTQACIDKVVRQTTAILKPLDQELCFIISFD